MQNKYSLYFYPKANEDLLSIYRYIANDLGNKPAAIQLIADIENALDNICLFPECCPIISNDYIKHNNIRKLIVSNYIVFYLVDNTNNAINVLRIIYGMMNYSNIL